MTHMNQSDQSNEKVKQILDVLVEYQDAHVNALIEAHETFYSTIHIRIIDPDFAEIDDLDRDAKIWALLKQLPEELFCKITMLILVTPTEAHDSGSSIEFDHPLPPLEQSAFWDSIGLKNGALSQENTLLVPLELEEAQSVKQIATSQGLSDSDLVREWIREKIQLTSNVPIPSLAIS